jgi:hypothetical protein
MGLIMVACLAMGACGGGTASPGFDAEGAAIDPDAPPPPKCRYHVDVAPSVYSGAADLPRPDLEAEATNAAVQALAAIGVDVKSRDDAAHVVVSAPFAGQTLVSNCGLNEYRGYTLRVSTVGARVRVSMDCMLWRGTEETSTTTHARSAGESCPEYMAKNDVTIAPNTAEMVVLLVQEQIRARTSVPPVE